MQTRWVLTSLAALSAAIACGEATNRGKSSSSPDSGNDAIGSAGAPAGAPGDCGYAPYSRIPGDSCGCNRDCNTAAVACLEERETGIPGGVCAQWCDPEEPDCWDGLECFSLGSSFCTSDCTSDDDCNNFHRCTDGKCCPLGECATPCDSEADCGEYGECSVGFCSPRCFSDGDCANRRCDLYTGRCQDPDPTKGDVLDPCVQGDDCKSGVCGPDPLEWVCGPAGCRSGISKCPRGTLCLDSGNFEQCVPPCETTDDCPADSSCVGFVNGTGCAPDMTCPDTPAETGGYCECNSQCPSGVCGRELEIGAPGGVCVQRCTTDAECGTGMSCFAMCGQECEVADDCETGRACVDGTCIPRCFQDTDCTWGLCNKASGECVLFETPGLLLRDEECADSSECQSNICSNGRCHQYCALSRPRCPDEDLCVPAIGDLGECHARCVDGDCPPGLRCEDEACVP